MAFDYYNRLSAADRRTYRKSDRISEVELPSTHQLHEAARVLELALLSEKRAAIERAAADLSGGITRALGAAPVRVKVLAKRPRQHGGELHGLYTLAEDGRALIQVWMRTAAQRRVVAFRTFLRTLLHEVCHHLDYTFFGLDESFHTEGFFRRESSLFRQIAPPPPAPRRRAGKGRDSAPGETAPDAASARKAPAAQHRASKQLSLFE